jgi:hypothetical protein
MQREPHAHATQTPTGFARLPMAALRQQHVLVGGEIFDGMALGMSHHDGDTTTCLHVSLGDMEQVVGQLAVFSGDLALCHV